MRKLKRITSTIVVSLVSTMMILSPMASFGETNLNKDFNEVPVSGIVTESEETEIQQVDLSQPEKEKEEESSSNQEVNSGENSENSESEEGNSKKVENVKKISLVKDKNNGKKYKENQIIVKYKKDKIELGKQEGKEKAKNFEKVRGLDSVDKIDKLNVKLLKSKNKTTEELMAELENDPSVEYVEPNYLKKPAYVPNDYYYGYQWPLVSSGSDYDIDAVEAWDRENNTSNVVVAVLDTGVNFNHVDLAANMWDGSGTCYDENNSLIAGGCPYHGWDFENSDNNPIDNDGHGTFSAGIIGAVSGNGTGISGLSRYNDIEIMALRFGFDVFSEAKAINFAENNGADVINASFGGEGVAQVEEEAIENFSGIFVASAGNDSADVDVAPITPCAYETTNIICVAATNQYDQFASTFSNYGDSVDMAAPGVSIVSTYPYDGNGGYSNNGYGEADGTSASAPFVAGAAALGIKQFPGKSMSEVRNLVIHSGDSLSSLSTRTTSGKRLNLDRLLSDTMSDNVVPDRVNPSPNNPLPSTTTSTTISLNTDENATCRYSTSPGVVYASMTNFSTTGGTDHSRNISGLSSGSSYTYYVKCRDESSNTNTDDFVITFTVSDGDAIAVYRFGNYQNGLRFWTTDVDEANMVRNDLAWLWKDEGIVFYVYEAQEAGTVPVYRFGNYANGLRFWTTDASERDMIKRDLSSIWKDEDVAFYVYPESSSAAGSVPVYRFGNYSNGMRFWTTDEGERSMIISTLYGIWKDENVAYKVRLTP